MTALSIPAPLLLKEARALAPIWLAAGATMWAGAAMGALHVGLFAFAFGAAALGASSIGHEYAHRTLTTLLAQPLARSRLLAAKVLVLAALLVLLTVVAWLMLLQADGMERLLGRGTDGVSWQRAILLLTPALGLCVAPWLTIACRGAMAGIVFTLAIPALCWLAVQIARAALSGFDVEPLAYGPGLVLMMAAVAAASVVGAVRGRARFLGLEALDVSADIAPVLRRRWRGIGVSGIGGQADADRRFAGIRGPLVALVRKEIRLQSLAFVVAGLYALCWIAMSLGRLDQIIAGQSFEALAGIYGGFLALLVGASASAEERALGTREWQALQPYAFWKQWAIKVVTISVLALVLGIGLAAVLEWIFPLVRDSGTSGPWSPPIFRGPIFRRLLGFLLPSALSGGALAIVVVVAISVFVSSLCTGGLRALIVALPFTAGLAWMYARLIGSIFSLDTLVLTRLYGAAASPTPVWLWMRRLPTASTADARWSILAFEWTGAVVLAGFLALMLRLAYRNHFSAEHGGSSAVRQMAGVAGYVIIGGAIAFGGPRVLEWFLFTH